MAPTPHDDGSQGVKEESMASQTATRPISSLLLIIGMWLFAFTVFLKKNLKIFFYKKKRRELKCNWTNSWSTLFFNWLNLRGNGQLCRQRRCRWWISSSSPRTLIPGTSSFPSYFLEVCYCEYLLYLFCPFVVKKIFFCRVWCMLYRGATRCYFCCLIIKILSWMNSSCSKVWIIWCTGYNN